MSVSSKGDLTNAAPKRTLNNDCYAVDGLLYNQSKVVSNRERNENINTGTPVDIYDIKTGEYKESFYIPYIKGQSAYKFKMYGDVLVAISRDYIASFQLAF